MGTTDTAIANMACDFLDVDPIGNLQQDRGGLAPILRRNFEHAVETVIKEFSWNCVRTRTTLTAIDAPEGWAADTTDNQYLYAYPNDCLGLIDINGRPIDKIAHEVETYAVTDGNGTVISRKKVISCSEAGPIIIRYKARIPPGDMDPHLSKAIAIELAQRCVMKAANSASKMEVLIALYEQTTSGTSKRKGGYQVDSRERKPAAPRNHASTGALARAGQV